MQREAERLRENTMLRILYMSLSVIFIAIFLAQNLGLVRCPLNDVSAAEKTELRRKWQRETAEWVRERVEHAAEVYIWEQERIEHAIDQTTWVQERSKHAADERTWEQERTTRRAEREEEERHRLEVVRRSQGVYWTEPHAERCHSYGTRFYSANLKDIPGDLNWLEVCESMPPVVIHGQNFGKPSNCDRDGNTVVGTWYIDFNEPSCKPYWDDFTDLVRAIRSRATAFHCSGFQLVLRA
ncbi:hypothetical protein TRAPUB_6150 [Trametes pubescens]|uniref:Uncharacterized protein n=1 Tax=Trametes pubescens TaxID=154538 RepID=A0A1M2V6S7_TRAPU|nr:hypothetical protein TRAPUB_6150 [Trametes pubescens]